MPTISPHGSPCPHCASILALMSVTATAAAILPKANESCWCGSGRKYKRCHKKSEGTRPARGSCHRFATFPTRSPGPPYADTGDVVAMGRATHQVARDHRERCATPGKVAAEVLRLVRRDGRTRGHHRGDRHLRPRSRSSSAAPIRPPSTTTATRRPAAPRSTRSSATASPTPRPLQDGDICNIDVTGCIGGVHGDTNATFLVGDVDPESRHLVRVTEECTWHGIEAVKPGRPLSDIGRGDRGPREAVPLRRRPRLRRPRHRRAVPHRHPGAALLRLAGLHDHAARDDVHDRADDHPRHRQLQGLGRRLDRGDRRRSSAPPSSSTPSSSPTTAYDVLTGGPGAASPTAPWTR